MTFLRITPFVLAATAFAAQGHAATTDASRLPDHATLPITFTTTVNAAHAKAGDAVQARTTQAVHLADGRIVPAGSVVTGHVLEARAFRYDNTEYAKQVAGQLDIQIDSLQAQGQSIPLHVSLRAMADPITSWQSAEPAGSDNDPTETQTQIGGDYLVPSQKEVRDRDGDVVGYNRKGGVYAHLVANAHCDGGETEQPVSQFAASACGLYGFTSVSLTSFESSHIGLASTHTTPQIYKHTVALLETMPENVSAK